MSRIQSELGRQLQELLALMGQPPSLELAPSLIPVANAFNLDDPPFHSKLGGMAGLTAGPVAAQYAQYAIGLPRTDAGGDPARRLVVRYATIGGSGIATPVCGFVDGLQVEPALGTVVLCPSWDQSRADPDNSTTQAQAIVRQGTSAVDLLSITAGFRGARRIHPANGEVAFIGPFVVGPGMFFVWHGEVPNVQSFASVYWDEYRV